MQTNRKEWMKSYISAADLLPETLWWSAFSIGEEERMACEEFRLRIGQPFELNIGGRPHRVYTSGEPLIVTRADIEAVLAKASRCSIHSLQEQLRQGFLTAAGGHRIGLCGSVTQNQEGLLVSEPSSVNIRIARQVHGIGDRILPHLTVSGRFESTLILSPPGTGKTTLLRDLCRSLSLRCTIAIADSRFELGGSLMGAPVFDLGRCDIMQGGRKEAVIPMLTRAMAPQVIAVDEITEKGDLQALLEGSYTGCTFLATAHGSGIDDLDKRPLYRELMELEIFDHVLLLSRQDGLRSCRIYDRIKKRSAESHDKNHWIDHDHYILLDAGDQHERGAAPAQPGHSAADHGAAAAADRDPL